MQGIDLHFADVRKVRDNIIQVSFKDLAEIEKKDAKELKDSILQLSQNHPYVLVLNGDKKRIVFSHDAREYLVQDQSLNEHIICEAYVAKSMSNKLIFHFFINFHKPSYPVQVFEELTEAYKWINSHNSDNIELNQDFSRSRKSPHI